MLQIRSAFYDTRPSFILPSVVPVFSPFLFPFLLLSPQAMYQDSNLMTVDRQLKGMGCSLSALFWTHNYFTSVTSLSPSPALHCHTHRSRPPALPAEPKGETDCVFVCVRLVVTPHPAKTRIAATLQPLLYVLVSVVTNQNYSLVAVCWHGGR